MQKLIFNNIKTVTCKNNFLFKLFFYLIAKNSRVNKYCKRLNGSLG